MRTDKVQFLTKITVLVVILFSLGMRFIYLEADFPSGITWSGVLYTDEGWYSNGAISYFLNGNWLIEGDFNTIVNVPIFQLLQSIAFKLIGLSLFSARITTVILFIFLVLFVYLLVRKYTDTSTALLATALLSTNYIIFAYSRLAILELPMTCIVLLSILLTLSFPRANNLLITCVSSVVFCVSVLTKTTALFALPLFLYATSLRHTNMRKRLSYSGLALVVVILFLSAYYVLVNSLFRADFEYFASLNIASRISWNPLSLGRNLIRAVWHSLQIDPVLFPLTIIMVPVSLLILKTIRKNIIVVLSVIWMVSYLGVLSVFSYQPPRYFLPLSIPIAILFSVISVSLYRKLRPHLWSYLPGAIFVFVIIMNGYSIVRYLQSPEFSFINMAHDIQRVVDNTKHKDQDVILLGDIANSISLVTGIPSINTTQGTQELRWKLVNYKPDYFVALGEKVLTITRIKKYYNIEELSTYNVFKNYYHGKVVHFYRITENTKTQ